jgi:hypothetical protein
MSLTIATILWISVLFAVHSINFEGICWQVLKKGICRHPHDSHIFVFDYCQLDILMVLIFPSRSSCLISSFL